jgi:hypothetical protein
LYTVITAFCEGSRQSNENRLIIIVEGLHGKKRLITIMLKSPNSTYRVREVFMTGGGLDTEGKSMHPYLARTVHRRTPIVEFTKTANTGFMQILIY